MAPGRCQRAWRWLNDQASVVGHGW